MTDDKREDDMLEAMFQAARADTRAQPGSELMVRILEDALTAQPQPAPAAPVTPERPGLMALLLAGLGGWRPMAGMVAATLAGVLIGFGADYVLPDGISGLLTSNNEIYLVDLELTAVFDFDEG